MLKLIFCAGNFSTLLYQRFVFSVINRCHTKGVARLPSPNPNVVLGFKTWDMPFALSVVVLRLETCLIFSKIAKQWRLSAPQHPLNLQYWWPDVMCFGQIVVFRADYDEIELQKPVMTSFQWRHRHYVTEKHHQNNVAKFFSFLAFPNQNFWLRQGVIHVFLLKRLGLKHL